MINIIIPYYKKVFFRQTLESLVDQTNKNFKVYVFNDNSPESPNDLIEEFKNKLNLVYFEFDENLGGKSLVKHWQRCIKKSNVEGWLMLLGDDDFLGENVIHDFYCNIDKIESLKIEVIRYATVVINDESERLSNIYTHPIIEKATDSLMRKIKNHTRSSLSEYVFKVKKFGEYEIIDLPNALFSDDLMLLSHSSFGDIFTVNTSIVQIRKSDYNLSGGVKLPNRHVGMITFYKILLLNYKDKFTKKDIRVIEKKFERELYNHKKIQIFIFFLGYYVFKLEFRSLLKFIFTFIKKLFKQIIKVW